MTNMLHSDSRRLYSWWWNSHISPKNSKWLQENLTDMDSNVKTMIKLIEEDADSFARRAEMYYKKRPELMKMVEEFYRAYRALAERYDHATGALRQAQKTMAEAFPNQIPFVLTDESSSSSSGNEMEPHTPEMHAPVRALFDSDDIQKDPLVISSNFHAIKRRGAYAEENDALRSRKGLKQLNEMISAGEDSASSFLAEGGVKKVLSFQDEGKNSEYKTPYCSKDLPNQESSEEQDGRDEVKFSEEISQLSQENTKLKSQITSESERADKAEDEVQTLKFSLSKLKIEMEDSISKYQQSLERIFYLEAQISHTQDDLKKLNDDVVNGSMKLCSAQEQCVLLEKTNQSLQLEQGMKEQKAKTQQEKLGKVQEESEKLNNTIQDERQRVMEAEIAIQIMEKLQSQYQEDLKLLTLEVERGIDKMKAMESRNTGLEEEIWHLKEENDSLNEQNLSSALKIKNLQDNIIILKETGEELEHKMGLNLEQTKGIQHEFDHVKEEKDDLERRYQGLMEKMEAVSLNAESLQQLLKELQGGHAELEEICKKQEDEKLLLLTNLKNMEKISEKNKVLELSLSDANIELEELRGRIKTLEGSCESAYGQIITHISEKAALVSQLETVAQNMEKMTEDNAFWENSVSDMNSELEDLRGKLKNLEDSYQSLYDQKANLVAENNILVSQVDSISQSIKGMENRYVELEDKHFNLEREKNSTLHQINELDCFLKLEKQECEVLTHSNKRQLATMENQIHFLQEDNQLGEEKFELEQQKLISALLESFVFQTCLNDMKAANLILSKDCQMYLQTSRCAEELVLQLEQKDLVQKKEIKSLSEYNEKLSENNAFLEKSLSDINDKLEDLRVKLNSSEESYWSLYDQKTNLLAEINARVCQVESTSQRLKSLESRHAELKDKHTHIQREKDSTLHQLKEVECLLKLKKQEQEALTRSSMSQLATMGNQIRLLREERQVREEEFEVEQQNVKSALFESFIFQRCLYDMNAKNLILLNDFRKHLQTSRCTEELVSQLEQMDLVQKKKIKSLSEDYEKLTENNIFLECSLSFMNIELEEMRGKLKNLEQSNQSLCDQKKNLLSENNTLVSQVESTSQRLKSLESRHAELKDKHTHIQREKDSTLHQLKEVECLLKLEKQEQEALTRSSKSQLATLGNQIRLLREERQVREEEFEVEQQKVTSALFESFIFQRCLYDMNAKNLILSNDFQKHLQTSRCTEELVSQLEQMDLVQKKRVKSLSEDYEKLTENNIFLECSLSFMKAELEEMRGKLKNLEQSNQSLCDEKKNLLSENNILVSQVRSISQSLKCLESRHADLEGNHLQLEKDKDLTLHHVVELECLLKLEKEQRETLSQSSKSQLATLENQIHILRKESRITEEEFEMEQQKVMNALFEIFILQRCVDDMEARNLILSKECQKHLQASTCAAEEISQLGQKDLIQMEKITSLSDHSKKLREGMLQLLSELNSNKEFESTVGVKDEVLLQIISDEIRMLLNSISDNQDEILHLELEILVIVTTLNQIGLDGKDIRREKDYLKLELEIREKELLVSQSKNQELVELKEHLRQDVQIRGQIVEELKTTIGTLHRKLSDMQQAHRTLQTEIHSLLNENQSLLAKFENLRDKNDLLEEENTAALAEAMTLEHLYLLFRSSNVERELDLKLCIDELGSLSAVKSNLDQEVTIMKEQMSQLEVENMKLKESAAYLEESRNRLIISEFDLNLARYVHEELNHQMETGKNLLMEKEVDLSEANQKVRSMQDMNIELSRNLANLIKEIDEGKMVRERMENMASSLSEGIALRDKNITNISEANNMLYIKLEKLHNEVEELKNREEHLTSILKEGISEVDQCGKDFAELLNENHLSSVCAAIFEDKLFELILACESLDIFSMVQKQAVNEAISSRKIFIIELKTKLDELEQENRGLKGDLDAYLPLIMSIWIGIASVEEQNLSLAGPRASNPQQKQDNSPVSHQDDQTSPSSEDHSTMAPAVGLLQLQKLVKKVEALQNMIGETGRLIEQERSDASMKENEALRLKGNAIREEGHISKDIIMELIQEDEENGDAGISKMRIEQMTKDIQLDEVSSSPPHVNDVGQHGLTRIGSSEIDDQMLELWEAAERNCDIGMHKLLPIALEQDINPVEKEKSECTSSELITEKELSIDRLELPKQLQEPHQELNKNVIERLALDSERLSVLRTSVEELKRKIEGSVKIKRPKSLEYDAVKMKLKEAEGGILELIDINTKSNDLRRGPEGIGSTGRRQLSDCSRSSEKIGNLELELQKIQYILLKLDEEHENSRTRGADRGAKVLLREYICERREKFRKKKVPFCGCMRPKTMDD